MQKVNKSIRDELPLRCLTLGLKCGGSDRFSGVAANAVLGALSDLIVENGGRVITETPEFEDSMELLAARATSIDTREWLLDLIPRFDRLCGNYPLPATGYQEIAPGNKGGGLQNARLKSAGALKKCGSKPVVGYLEYGETLTIDSTNGVYVLDCPSYDQISTTALLLSGAQTVAFTIGLGTTISSGLSPVLKIRNQKKNGT
jgi:altronate dehydratase